MRADGYFDMSAYIFGRIKKENLYAILTAAKSKYAILYQGSYPKKENAMELWIEKFRKQPQESFSEDVDSSLTYDESSAIVNWVYRTMKNSQEREEYTNVRTQPPWIVWCRKRKNQALFDLNGKHNGRCGEAECHIECS